VRIFVPDINDVLARSSRKWARSILLARAGYPLPPREPRSTMISPTRVGVGAVGLLEPFVFVSRNAGFSPLATPPGRPPASGFSSGRDHLRMASITAAACPGGCYGPSLGAMTGSGRGRAGRYPAWLANISLPSCHCSERPACKWVPANGMPWASTTIVARGQGGSLPAPGVLAVVTFRPPTGRCTTAPPPIVPRELLLVTVSASNAAHKSGAQGLLQVATHPRGWSPAHNADHRVRDSLHKAAPPAARGVADQD